MPELTARLPFLGEPYGPPHCRPPGEMAAMIRRLLAALLEGNKLVAQIDEGHSVTLAAQICAATILKAYR